MRFNIRILVIILALMLLAATMAKSQDDPNLPDTLYIDSVTAFTTGVGVVPVRIANDEEISAVEITLVHSAPDVAIDSFSFAGGRLDYIANKGFTLHPDGQTVTVHAFVVSETLVPAGSGLVGHLYYSYAPTISPQVVEIDTTTIIDEELREKSTLFRVSGGVTFVPQVIEGFLDIKEAPLVMDSLWLDDVDVEAGKEFAIDVFLYNEHNLQAVSVALDYGDEYLQYDSITFEGTRGVAATNKQVQHSSSFNLLWAMLTFPDIAPLEPGSGALATIHFTVDSQAPETDVTIDSTTYFTIGNTFVELTALDGGIQLTPHFTPGVVSIKVPTDVGDDHDLNLPNDYSLAQNYPNPFNPTTTIGFSLPVPGDVRLDIYNVLGQRVRTLIDRTMSAGTHEIDFDSRNDAGTPLSSGIYFYRIVTESFVDSRKMVLMK